VIGPRIRLFVLYGLVLGSTALTYVISSERDALLESMDHSRSVPHESTVARADESGELDVPQETLSHLAALGYAPYANVPLEEEDRSGVVEHEAASASSGVNVVFPEFGCERIDFMDNDGSLIDSIDVSRLPKSECYSVKPVESGYVFLARPNLFRLDEQGQVVWKLVGGFNFHHDFGVDSERVVALDQWPRAVMHDGVERSVVDHRLVTIGLDGRVWSISSLHDLFWPSVLELAESLGVDPFAEDAVERFKMDKPGDFYHANSVQILESDSEIGRRGDVLISLRTLDTIATIDLVSASVAWRFNGAGLDHPHHPTLLSDGRILIFDNGWSRDYSRVIELDPATGEIVWQYQADPPSSFYSKRRGAAYRLPNGNTLITESNRGRAFEVTRSGERVWEYWMPPSLHRHELLRSTLFRLQRLSEEEYAARASGSKVAASRQRGD
jgi:hypothetical protein